MAGGISLRLGRLRRLLLRLRVRVRKVRCTVVREGVLVVVGSRHSGRGWIPQGRWNTMLQRRLAASNIMASNTAGTKTTERLFLLRVVTKRIPTEITITARRTITRHLRIISNTHLIRCMICRRSTTFLHPLAPAQSEDGTIRPRCRIVLSVNMLFRLLILLTGAVRDIRV